MTKYAKNLPPFMRFCTASIPTLFDDSMSYYEVLCALTKIIKDNIEVTNENAKVLEELYSYTHNYFDNLDVQEEINNKLDQMAEDGTLKEIFMSRDFQDNTVLYLKTSFVKSIFTGDTEGINGGCLLPDNTIIQFTGKGQVLHYSEDGTLLNSRNIDNIGHCNSACYNEDKEKVYVTTTGSSSIGYYKVFEIDPVTLELTDTIDCADKEFPAAQLGIVYDKETKGYIFANWWGDGATRYLWKTDENFNVTSQVTIDFSDVKASSDIGYFGKYIAINNMFTHQMFLFRKEDLSYYKVVSLSELVSETWVITEEEWWDTKEDGTIVVCGHASASAEPHTGHGTYIYAHVNPANNYRACPLVNKYSPKSEFYYIDHTYTSSDRDGTSAHPFNNIYEALNSSLRTSDCTGSVTIRFSNGSQNIFNPVFTNGKQYQVWFPNNTIDFFGSIAVESGANVEINRPVTLQLLETKTNPFGEGEADIHCYGHLTIDGALTTPNNVTPTIRGYQKGLFSGFFDTCGLDVQNYYGSLKQFANTIYPIDSQIKNLHFSYNQNSFSNEYKGVKGSISKNSNDKYVVPALSKTIMLIPKFTIKTSTNISTAIEEPIIWNVNLWCSKTVFDQEGNKHTLSVSANGELGISSSGGSATIDRLRIISL